MHEVTHLDTAPFFGRVLLATADGDEPALLAALVDAASEGVDAASLLVVTTQALIVHLDHANPEWREQIRQSLLEAHS